MDYQNTLKYLFESVPMFQQIGSKAYKPGLDTTYQLDTYFNHPHHQFKTIHVAGTNGKGSCSHTIAAVLQSAGYRVGLFTSPHLIDFRERIRINGQMMPESYVIQFVEKHRSFFEPLHPSFFELTTAMAFSYFAEQKVDVAIIEVGMGGRLDCTNIINPDLCVITNISYDHMQYLGDTLPKIAHEKAGIIKHKTPVIIGRANGEVKQVFLQKAKEMEAPIIFAQKLALSSTLTCSNTEELKKRLTDYTAISHLTHCTPEDKQQTADKGQINAAISALQELVNNKKQALTILSDDFPLGLFNELTGYYQRENCLTILAALNMLRRIGYQIHDNNYYQGFANVCQMTGLMGRWQKLHSKPDIYCDTGHNEDGIRFICQQLQQLCCGDEKRLHIVFGMVSDKDIRAVLKLLPKHANYYFTKASVKRAMPENELQQLAAQEQLYGEAYPNVADATQAAKNKCLPKDYIFIGGSNFIIADLLSNRNALDLY